MKNAEDFRAEAQRLRAFALTVSDPPVLTEIRLMIEELERRARAQENGGASSLADITAAMVATPRRMTGATERYAWVSVCGWFASPRRIAAMRGEQANTGQSSDLPARRLNRGAGQAFEELRARL
jgi:hypothetical protein